MIAPIDILKVNRVEQELGRGIGGWISPDGLFFQAHYYEHDDVAELVAREFLRVRMPYAAGYLLACGWVRLETSGWAKHNAELTVQQFDILYWCYSTSTLDYYRDELYETLFPILEYAREPMPRVPGQGDQENWSRKEQLA